jgi:hypothetical protein
MGRDGKVFPVGAQMRGRLWRWRCLEFLLAGDVIGEAVSGRVTPKVASRVVRK